MFAQILPSDGPPSGQTRANLFHADPLGEALFGNWLGPSWGELRPIFASMGEAAAIAEPFSAAADRSRPTLLRGDATDADRVGYHPATQALEDLAYATGLASRRNDLGFLVRHGARRNLIGIGSGYYFAQTEIGLMCQICMTDSVGLVIERHASNALARRVLPRLGHPDRQQRLRGAMFLTERQGGSDLGKAATIAQSDGSRWRLDGEKAFCSNVDAEAVLTLARMPNGPPGTRGLGLFLILRDDPPGNAGTIRILRLLQKLGVASTPTGDVRLAGTEAHLIAGANEGFKCIVEVISLTRLYNAVASLAGLRRALLHALAHGDRRQADGERLWELPLWRAGMADLVAEHLGAFLLTFAAVRALDAADAGDTTAMKEVRLLIPIAKALTGKLAVFGVSECIEAVGGAGYLEEGILPRLLRDVQVLPIWEGTTNILTLDAARALARERAHEAFFDRLARAQADLPQGEGGRGMHEEIQNRILHDTELLQALATSSAEGAQRGMREWMESAGRTAMLAFLLEAAATPALRDVCLAAFRRLQVRPYTVTPLVSAGAADLADTEEVLLRAGYAPQR